MIYEYVCAIENKSISLDKHNVGIGISSFSNIMYYTDVTLSTTSRFTHDETERLLFSILHEGNNYTSKKNQKVKYTLFLLIDFQFPNIVWLWFRRLLWLWTQSTISFLFTMPVASNYTTKNTIFKTQIIWSAILCPFQLSKNLKE